MADEDRILFWRERLESAATLQLPFDFEPSNSSQQVGPGARARPQPHARRDR